MRRPGILNSKILSNKEEQNLKIWKKSSYKGNIFKKFDIVLFNDKNNSTSVGIILNDELDWNEIEEPRYEICYLENFQYVTFIPITKIIKKNGHNNNFEFINDNSNHIFEIGDKILFKYSKEFLINFWEYSNHNFNISLKETENEFKKFNDFSLNEIVEVEIVQFIGPYLSTVKILKNENKDFELYENIPEKLLAKFQVESNKNE